MRFYQEKLVNRIRRRRLEGRSIKSLEREFSVPNTTISRWVRDISSDNRAFQEARELERGYKAQLADSVTQLKTSKKLSQIFAALLYWCEGSKHPSSNYLAFSNSDPALVKTFLYMLRKGFTLEEHKIRAHLQLHTNQDIKVVTGFWSALLKIPPKQFYKATITAPAGKMKRRNYIGTFTIKYFDVRLLLQITGIFEGFAKRFGEVPEWSNGTRC